MSGQRPLRRFEWRTRSGATKVTKAEAVTFEAGGAMVFRVGGRIVLAVPGDRWFDLREDDT